MPILVAVVYRLRWPVYGDPRVAGLCRSLTGSHPGCRAPVQRAVALALRWTLRRHPGRLPALRAGSGGPHACCCGPGSSRAAGAATALGPRLDLPGSPGALQRPHWGGARLRVSPGAGRD